MQTSLLATAPSSQPVVIPVPNSATDSNSYSIDIEFTTPDGKTSFKFSNLLPGNTNQPILPPSQATGLNGQGSGKAGPLPSSVRPSAARSQSLVMLANDPGKIVKAFPKANITSTVICDVALDITNTTTAPLTESLQYQQTVKFDSVSEVSFYRKQVNQADLDVETGVSFDGVTGSVGMKYSQLVENYYSSKDTVTQYQESSSTQTFTVNLQPGNRFTLYKITERAGSYENVYYTTTKVDPANSQLSYTMFADLSQACISFLNKAANPGSPNSDYDEWSALTGNATAALALQGDSTKTVVDVMNKFIQLNLGLWTNGIDQDSWGAVLAGMQTASTATTSYSKFINMLSGFTKVTSPSHNGSMWGGLHDLAVQYSQL